KAAGEEGATPEVGGNPLAGLMGGGAAGANQFVNLLQAAGGGQIPKYTLVAEVDDQAAFAKVLDNLMVAVNQQLKAHATQAAERGPAAEPLEEGAPKEKGEARSKRRAPAATAEFKLFPARDPKERVYTLTLPPNAPRSLPAGFRPTVRLGAKHVALAATPDAA